jgi:cytochrome c553
MGCRALRVLQKELIVEKRPTIEIYNLAGVPSQAKERPFAALLVLRVGKRACERNARAGRCTRCHRAERVAGRNDKERLGAAVPRYAGLRRKIVGAGYRYGPCVAGSTGC